MVKPVKASYTVDEVAEIFGVCRRTVYRRIKSGDLNAFRPWPHSPWRIPQLALKKVHDLEIITERRCNDCIFSRL